MLPKTGLVAGSSVLVPSGVVKISANSESVVAGGARKPDANTIPAPPPELANGAANDATGVVVPCAATSIV